VTSFSVLRKGGIVEFELDKYEAESEPAPACSSPEGAVRAAAEDLLDKRRDSHSDPSLTVLSSEYLWPNELTVFKSQTGQDVMIVPDGFLTPGMYGSPRSRLPSRTSCRTSQSCDRLTNNPARCCHCRPV
jgi:hypothetical protein